MTDNSQTTETDAERNARVKARLEILECEMVCGLWSFDPEFQVVKEEVERERERCAKMAEAVGECALADQMRDKND